MARLFQRFRRPQWQHADPSIRRQAVARLSAVDGQQAEVLGELAIADRDPSVRAAAVKRLADPIRLRARMHEDDHAAVREAARARYSRLLAGGCEGWDLDARLAELNGCQDTLVLAQVARRARDEAMRAAALARLRDDNILEEAALHDPVARVRQLAVERITDPEALQRLARAGRVADRRIARLARQRLETTRERALRTEQARHEAQRLCEEVDALAGAATPDAVLAAKRQRLDNRWEALGDAPTAEQKQRFRAAMETLGARVASVSRERSACAPSGAPEPPSLAVTWARLDLRQEPDAEIPDIIAQALAADKTADATLRTRAQQAVEGLRRYLTRREALASAATADARDALLTAIDWPEGLVAPPILQQARKRAAAQAEQPAERARRPAAHAARAELERLSERLSALEADLDAGRLRAARRDLQRSRRMADQVPGGLPAELERRLARAASRVAEWRDWQRFAVLPKQEALCEEIEALAEDPEPTPSERMERIRMLQRRWKATGGSDSPRGHALWQRFRAGAERAFEPCRAHLDAEARRRQQNLLERERIATQLQGFVDQPGWADTAVSQLERIRGTARREWQNATPVDRADGAEVARRFETLMDRLTEVIDGAREAARNRKEELIARAGQLADADDPEWAAQQAKALQQSWKSAGPVRSAQERALWRRFRAACDTIFARRDERRREDRGREATILCDAEALCARLEAVTALDDHAAAQREVTELAGRFRSLPLPSAAGRAPRIRFERAERAAYRHLETLLVRRQRHEIEQLLAPAIPASGPIDSGAAQRAREITVRLEILAGLPSPPDDTQLRLSQQVERLNRGIGEGVREATRTEARRLVAEWGDTPDNPPELLPRVRRAVEKLFPV